MQCARGACKEIRNLGSELLDQFAWTCRACGHVLYSPGDVSRPNINRVFEMAAQLVPVNKAPGIKLGEEFSSLDGSLRMEMRRWESQP